MPVSSSAHPEGGCGCRAVRYRLTTAPLIVHCCHCRWCQRETGASFALNAMYESDRVLSLGTDPEVILTPSNSGKGQRIARCPHCRVAVWSHYAGSGPVTRFVRVGTLDDPDAFPPDVHIFTATKQPWVVLPADRPSFAEYYDRSAIWSSESLARFERLKPLIAAYKKEGSMPSDKRPTAARAADIPVRVRPSAYPEPFASRMAGRAKRQLGEVFGLSNYGVNLTTLAPGGSSSLRHAHTRQDEFVYILSGTATLHTDEGYCQLAPGMCAGFKAGSGNAHRLLNETGDEVVYLEIGDRSAGDEASYPDDDIKAMLVEGKWVFTTKSGDPY